LSRRIIGRELASLIGCSSESRALLKKLFGAEHNFFVGMVYEHQLSTKLRRHDKRYCILRFIGCNEKSRAVRDYNAEEYGDTWTFVGMRGYKERIERRWG
jgi:hypothetical protein